MRLNAQDVACERYHTICVKVPQHVMEDKCDIMTAFQSDKPLSVL